MLRAVRSPSRPSPRPPCRGPASHGQDRRVTHDIAYALEEGLGASDFAGLLESSGLAERRPAGDLARLDTMLRQADLVMTARRSGRLVGLARTITDYAYCAYLSDLCVAREEQGSGVGRNLVARTKDRLGDGVTLHLIAAPGLADYYRGLGMTQLPDTFCYGRSR